MHMNWKLAAPVAVVVIALVAVTGISGKPAPTDMAQNRSAATMAVTADSGSPAARTMMASKNAAQPSGNVDDLTASLIGEADQDLTFVTDTDEDMSYLTSDSASINGYATAYDETTF